MDNSLNADFKRPYDKYCVVTYHYKNIDRRKFSMSTPRLIARRIHLLVENKEEGVLNSERIFHDCDKALDAMYTVYFANTASMQIQIGAHVRSNRCAFNL